MSDRPIVENAADAERVSVAARALVRLLVREDPLVREVYERWSPAVPPGATLSEALLNDLLELKAVLTRLHLEQYRWLPRSLVLEFGNAWALDHGEPWRVVEELPADLPWAEKGRAPKHGPVHREDIERSIRWFYRVKVRGESVRAIAKEYAQLARRHTDARSNIQKGIVRAEALLAYLD